jgi:hypothetical protein
MLTSCSECLKTLTVRDNTSAKKARCPHCKSVFVAEPYVEPELVEPETEPPAMDVESTEPGDDQAPAGDNDQWSFGKPTHLGDIKTRVHEDLATRHGKAIAAMRPAANSMLAAFLLTLIEFLLNVAGAVYVWYLRIQHAFQNERLAELTGPLVGACIGVLALGIARLCMGLAVLKLYRAGSRKIIITGICFDLLLMFAYLIALFPGVYLLYVLLTDPNPGAQFTRVFGQDRFGAVAVIIGIWSQFVIVVVVVGLLAAMRAIRALRNEDVQNYYYQLRIRESKRRRALDQDD